jgi:hypothetical protein
MNRSIIGQNLIFLDNYYNQITNLKTCKPNQMSTECLTFMMKNLEWEPLAFRLKQARLCTMYTMKSQMTFFMLRSLNI